MSETLSSMECFDARMLCVNQGYGLGDTEGSLGAAKFMYGLLRLKHPLDKLKVGQRTLCVLTYRERRRFPWDFLGMHSLCSH